MASTTRVTHKTVKVGGLDIFYREAGPREAPAVLLLHGFPTSSQMFRNLIPLLADEYRLVAPDYPGFGHSSMPPRDRFAYTFDNLARVIDEFTQEVGLARYALYVQDYGAPVGYRLAVQHPERVTAIVVQHPSDGIEDGHEIVFQTDPPKHEYECFLASSLHGVPKVPDGGDPDAGCP